MHEIHHDDHANRTEQQQKGFQRWQADTDHADCQQPDDRQTATDGHHPHVALVAGQVSFSNNSGGLHQMQLLNYFVIQIMNSNLYFYQNLQQHAVITV